MKHVWDRWEINIKFQTENRKEGDYLENLSAYEMKILKWN